MRVIAAGLLAAWVSFLPRGWRGWFAPDEELYRPALVSGIMQYALCPAILLVRLVVYIQTNVSAVGASAVARGEQIELNRAQYDVGFVVSTGYFFRPLTVVLFYLMCEGMARFLAGAVTREVLGTAPFYLVAALWRGCARFYSGLCVRGSSAQPSRKVPRSSSYSSLELRNWPPSPSADTKRD